MLTDGDGLSDKRLIRPAIVVPCYNEADRWIPRYWAQLRDFDIDLLFVDDGSSDNTWEKVSATCEGVGAQSLRLSANVGKAEAVRMGLRQVLAQGAQIVGFLDADGAFPAEVVGQISHQAVGRLSAGLWDSVWAARILMGGRDVVRKPSRHYLGRLVATLIASDHGHAVYDTQTGFKLFENSASLEACLAGPFTTRWFVDVELLMRWRAVTGQLMRVWEEPVEGWRDIGGSKVNRGQYAQLARDIIAVKRYRLKG